MVVCGDRSKGEAGFVGGGITDGEDVAASSNGDAPMAIVVSGDETRSFYWYLDCSAAAQNILLAAESLGLGAVWTATYPYPDRMRIVADQLALPDRIKSLCVIPVGYPAGETSPKDKWNEDCIHQNKW